MKIYFPKSCEKCQLIHLHSGRSTRMKTVGILLIMFSYLLHKLNSTHIQIVFTFFILFQVKPYLRVHLSCFRLLHEHARAVMCASENKCAQTLLGFPTECFLNKILCHITKPYCTVAFHSG